MSIRISHGVSQETVFNVNDPGTELGLGLGLEEVFVLGFGLGLGNCNFLTRTGLLC